ncbi:hypothetical protein [Halomonas llamarensis]|uniref:Transposase n=1 Tax=Halomonas llamarensis TaxID=2945104 RepID=A0ABT0SRI7_9GAMM|nr:hypothetical protein [Halomonas llamarensis]MCL7930407.1 hypothetical protein [Halomonas llamarensis]
MSPRNRQPLNDAEIEFLVQLANGNALARQRRKDRNHKKNGQKPPPENQY